MMRAPPATAEDGAFAVGAALAACAADEPEAARRGRLALDRVLAGVRGSAWPEVAWRFSRLCPGGFPVEFVWRPGHPGTFWTAEVAGPEMQEAERLACAARLLSELGSPAPGANLLSSLVALQAGVPLAWGAWLAGRHTAAGDRFKLYAEVPPECRAALARAFPAASVWLASLPRRSRMRLVGHEPANGRTELYARLIGFEPGDLYLPMQAAGPAGRTLAKALTELCGGLPDDTLDGKGIGASVTLDGGGEIAGMAAIVVARRLLGSERRLKQRLAPLAARPGSALARLWLAGGADATLLSLSASTGGAAALHLGLRPTAGDEAAFGRQGTPDSPPLKVADVFRPSFAAASVAE